MTDTQTTTWLGTRNDNWMREHFPEGTLTDKQVRTILKMEEGSRRVQNLSETMRPAILKVTEEITEIHTDFGGAWPNTQTLVLWLNTDGKFLAAVEEKYEGPRGLHRPGDTFRKWGVGYLRTPDMSPHDKAVEVEYERMWCISDKGAVDQVRKFIKENWL